MLHDCKLNGWLSSNVDGHVDTYLLIFCSMPLTIIVRLVFNINNLLYKIQGVQETLFNVGLYTETLAQ